MKAPAPKPMLVAGIMSGTSADGVDVALCRIAMGRDGSPQVKVLGHRSFPYDRKLRAEVLAVAGGAERSAAQMAELSWKLGAVYAQNAQQTCQALGHTPHLVAMHGQTVIHQAAAKGPRFTSPRFTWQMGEAAVIAEALRVPVVSDFRPADLAAGGQGAPLVPMLDWTLFRHPTRNRILLNLGGIANVAVLPANCGVADVLAFDTGPANMVIDAAMQRLFHKNFDRNGSVAKRGCAKERAIVHLLQHPFFSHLPPKSCGREEFGATFFDNLIAACEQDNAESADIIATATQLTVASLREAVARWCLPHLAARSSAKKTELLIAGGGAKNTTLVRMLTLSMKELGIEVATTEDLGIAVEAKEAAAFALLGWLTWHRLPGNVPSATGADHSTILGKVLYG